MTGKMTLSIDTQSFAHLLSQYLPQTITSEAENERALVLVRELMEILHPSPEKEFLMLLLAQLIKRFENEHYSLNPATPLSILTLLMEEHDLGADDLIPIFGDCDVVDAVIKGNRMIEPQHVPLLANLFHVNPSVFKQSVAK
jgi:HTH-type transcriptional regulator / antitoxin HigA